MTIEHIETLIIGGGQAGLTMSHRLSQRGRPHLVLERHRIAERWRTERWDGLRFQFPNWSVRLPDFAFRHDDPDGFTTSAAIVDFITAYADFIKAPIRCGVEVSALRTGDTMRFLAETSRGPIAANNVVVATGPYQRARIPDLPMDGSVFQVHASHYTNPTQLPEGAVLIVGAGASGAQIAEELLRAGRPVYLCVGEHKRMPRRYRGKDLIRWLEVMKLDQTSVEQRGASTALPLITGAYGGHTIDLRRFAADGVTLLGRLQAVQDGVLHFADDLADSLAQGDVAHGGFLDRVDEYIARENLDAPPEPEARIRLPDPPSVSTPIRSLDMRASGINSVLWSTGYSFDYSWLHLPVLNARGEPQHRHGVTDVPGLYFLGLQWLSKMNSSFLSGVGDDAARLADHIAPGAR
jgi:putative flavoprotein involved in K+ transport